MKRETNYSEPDHAESNHGLHDQTDRCRQMAE